MNTEVEFSSDAFPAYPTESKEINPRRWGKRLAEFLEHGLPDIGITVGEPRAEDWGWILPIYVPGLDAFVGCGNIIDSDRKYLCFIYAKRHGWLKWFAKADPGRVDAISIAIDSVLRSNPQVRDIEWFVGPKRST